MSYRPLSLRCYRRAISGGFTLVELLVVIAIIGLLASVAFPAITSALNNAKHNIAMQNARSIDQAMFQFALDPSNATQAFPAGSDGTSTQAFVQLLSGKYLSNAAILYIAGTGKTSYVGQDPTQAGSLASANVSWDIMVNSAAGTGGGAATITGLSTNASDDTPLVFSTGNSVNLAATGVTTVTMTKATNPFGTDGMAVGYKAQNAFFKKATNNGGTYTLGITPASYNDTAYTQQKP